MAASLRASNKIRATLVGLFGLLALFVGLSANAVILPNQPLLADDGVQPNVMLLMDTSTSMSTFITGDYDPEIDYGSACPEANVLPALFVTYDEGGKAQNPKVEEGDWVSTQTLADGEAAFTYGGVQYSWGVSGDSGTRCFSSDPDSRYSVYYLVDSTLRSALLPGNFWNYYFSNSDQTSPDNWGEANRKFGVGQRIDFTVEAATLLLETLADVNIGLANFITDDGDNGAYISVGITDVEGEYDENTSQREKVIEEIGSLRAQGFTPLAEAISDVARFFIGGFEDETLQWHPDTPSKLDDPESVVASEVFSTLPTLGPGVEYPTADNPMVTEFCQESYVVAFTDGLPYELGLVSPLLVGGDTVSETPYIGYDVEFGEDQIANTIAIDKDGNVFSNQAMNDVVMAMFDLDLRPDLNDQNRQDYKNNIKTFFIGGFLESLATDRLLNRAADNGVGSEEGKIYFASDTESLLESFEEIFTTIIEGVGSFTAVAFNAGSIESDTGVYQASYRYAENYWAGDVQAFPLTNPDANGGELFSSSPVWSAGEQLTQRVQAENGHLDREILTMSRMIEQDGVDSRDGVPFQGSNLNLFPDSMIADLTGDDSDLDLGARVIDFLRGKESEEFRKRIDAPLVDDETPEPLVLTENDIEFGVLGDIINSSPIEVAEPEINYPDYDALTSPWFGDSGVDGDYSSFSSAYANRKSVIYVGSNDGMLHAFDGDITEGGTGGRELFAYIPSMVANGDSENEGLFYLTDPSYNHRFYVDGTITASDVFIDPLGVTDPEWRTVLVGGLRAGGRGLFALDITDPSVFEYNAEDSAEEVVLWEFDGTDGDTGDSDMGYVYGEPKIAMLNNGKFAVITGNGVNSDSGEAKLFIIFLQEGVDGIWSAGDYIELDTDVAGDNGLFAPVLVDLNGDRVVDRAYAGDLKGNLWAFDLDDTVESNWTVAHQSGGLPAPLFKALYDDGGVDVPQPITTTPLVLANQDTATAGNLPNVLVVFGTGKLIEDLDPTNSETQSFYAVWDRGDSELEPDDLHRRVLVNVTDALDPSQIIGRKFSENSPESDPVDWYDFGTGTGEYGWYFDLSIRGERSVLDPTVLLGTIFFSTSIPLDSACSGGGFGFLNSLGIDGLATQTPIYDFNGDGVVDDEDQGYVGQPARGGLPAGSTFIGAGEAEQPCPKGNGQYQAYATSSGEIHYRWVCPEDSTGFGRLAWEELFGG